MNKYDYALKYAASSGLGSKSVKDKAKDLKEYIAPGSFFGDEGKHLATPARWFIEDLPGGDYSLNTLLPKVLDAAEASPSNDDSAIRRVMFVNLIDGLKQGRKDYMNGLFGNGGSPELNVIRNHFYGTENNYGKHKSYGRQLYDSLKTRRNMGIAQLFTPSLNYPNYDKNPDKYYDRLKKIQQKPSTAFLEKAQLARAITSAALIGGGATGGGIAGFYGGRAAANALGLSPESNRLKRLGRYSLMTGSTLGGAYLGGNLGAVGAGYLTKVPNAGNNMISVSAQEGTKKHRAEIDAMKAPWYKKQLMHLSNNLIGDFVDGTGNVLLGTNVFDIN